MIKFKSVRWKNFLSTGNNFNEIDLGVEQNVLVVGDNGSGKSTMLDAISFGLFGKPYRNINKSQLINSINNKDCVVEVEFETSGNEYKVVRGIKPSTFEIHKNGTPIRESSTVKEFQKTLENNILKLNHKSFHQIVVVGSSSFVPFMQLAAAQRREIIEDLLDIGVFSKMNTIIKDKLSDIKNSVKENSYELDKTKNGIDVQKKYINDVKNLNENYAREQELEILKLKEDIQSLEALRESTLTKIESSSNGVIENLSSLKGGIKSVLREQALIDQKLESLVKNAKFFENNNTCPTCTQPIDEETKKSKIKSFASEAKELSKTHESLKENESEIETKILEAEKHNNTIGDLRKIVSDCDYEISRANNSVNSILKKLSSNGEKQKNLGRAESELQNLVHKKDALLDKKIQLDKDYNHHRVAMEMLKDTGIKTKIVKQYIPVMNNYINEYLNTLDFFVNFELTESFQEIIKSRHLDSFSYENFSEGEKQRIDLALLFTWRQIAKTKNSASTNLLILDEVFDSSLDNDGIENLFKIMGCLDKQTSVFVISHKGEVLENRFPNKIEFVKEKNFSKIKERG